jgi:hypothetical protein
VVGDLIGHHQGPSAKLSRALKFCVENKIEAESDRDIGLCAPDPICDRIEDVEVATSRAEECKEVDIAPPGD